MGSLNILGLVLARAGSKGLPGKNLMRIRGRSLLERAIGSARESRHINRVLLTTEDAGYAEVGRAAGAEVPFLRPPELATDTAGTWDVVRHAVHWLEAEDHWPVDVIVLLQPTTPFRRGHHIDAVVDQVLAGTDTAMTVREVDYPPQWMMRMDEGGRLFPLITDLPRPKRRQDAVKVYQPNGLVYVLRRPILDRAVPVPGPETVGVPMGFEESVNIDDAWQFDLATVMAERLEGDNG